MRGTVLDALKWTYQEEMLKRGEAMPSGWGRVGRYAELGGVEVSQSGWNLRGPVTAGPHGDALALSGMVDHLGLEAAVEEGAPRDVMDQVLAHCLGPMARNVDPDAAWRLLCRRDSLSGLVRAVATGIIKPPAAEAWHLEPMRNEAGRPLVVGATWDRRSMRVQGVRVLSREMTGGYVPLRWSPDPLAVLAERIEWALACEGLERIEARIAACPEVLTLWQVRGTGAARMPWRADTRGVVARVLQAGGVVVRDAGDAAPTVRQHWGQK